MSEIRSRCRAHLEQGEFERALDLAEESVRLDPENSYGHYLLGMSYLGLGRLDEVGRELERAIQLDPSFGEAHAQLGELYSLDYQTFVEAALSLQKAIELGVSRVEIRKDLGLVLLKLRRPAEALVELELALQEDPQLAETYYLLADAHRRLGNQEKAAAALSRFKSLRATLRNERDSREADMERVQDLYQQAEDHLFENRPGQAYSLLLEALEISPDLDLVLFRLAQIDFLRGDVGLAEDRVGQAIHLNPSDPEYHFLAAKCLEPRDPAAAIEAIRRAIELSPSVADFHNLLANLLFAKGDFPNAVEAYRRAIAVDPADPVPHLNLSTALRNMGRMEESERERDLYFELQKAQQD